MSDLPFLIHSDALNWIVKKVKSGATRPEMAGLAPGLYSVINANCKGIDGQLVEWWPNEFFEVFWDTLESFKMQFFIEIESQDLKIFVAPDIMKRLEGKQLILETAEIGYPTPADKKCQLLVMGQFVS